MKIGIKIILSVLILVFLASCATTNQQSSHGIPTISIAISGDANAEKLDATSYDSDMPLYGAVYESLVQYGEKGAYTSGLADSWEISEDGKKYTFHLKKDSKFSDGSTFDAEAVKFTIERAKIKNETTTLQTLINLEKIEVLDSYTIVLYFKEPSNQVLAELSQTRPLRIMSPHSVENNAVAGVFKEAIGTGPFKIKEFTSEQVTMEPNPYFNGNQPVTYQIKFKTIEDGSSRTLALKSGEVDIVGGTLGNITEKDSELLEADASFTVHAFKGTMSHFLAFNPENPALKSPIRQAMDSAINKKELSTKQLNGLFRDNVEYVTSDNQPTSTYDLKKAQSILEQEGFQKNSQGYYEKEGKELAFKLVIQTTEFPEWKEQAEVIESELKKAGIKVTITILDSESYYDVLWNTKDFDLIFYRTYTDALLPYNFLNSLFHNTAESHGVLADDVALTKLLDQSALTINETTQQEVFDGILKRINQETLAIPIDYKDEIFVTSEKIAEFSYSGLSDAPIDFKNIKVK